MRRKETSTTHPILPPLTQGALPDFLHELDLAAILPTVSEPRSSDGEQRALVSLNDAQVRRTLDRVRVAVQSLQEGQVLLLRFDRVRLGPELAGPLALTLFSPRMPGGRLCKGHPVLLVNPDTNTLFLVHQALEAAGGIGSALFTAAHPWELMYVGRLEKHLHKALNELTRSNEPVVTEPSSKPSDEEEQKTWRKQVVNAARQLGELYEYGLARRVKTGRGREFAYTFFHPYTALHPEAALPSLPFHFFAGFDPWRARAFYEAALVAYQTGRYEEARKQAEESRLLFTRLESTSALLEVSKLLGDIAVQQGDCKTAKKHHRKRLQLLRQIPSDNDQMASVYHSLGWTLAENASRFCEVCYKKSIALRKEREASGSLSESEQVANQLEMTRTLNNLSNVYAAWKQFDKARAYGTEALLTCYRQNDHRGVASTLFSFALHALVEQQWARMVTLEAAGAKTFADAKIAVPRNIKRAVSHNLKDALAALGKKDYMEARRRGQNLSLVEAIEFAIGHSIEEAKQEMERRRTLLQ